MKSIKILCSIIIFVLLLCFVQDIRAWRKKPPPVKTTRDIDLIIKFPFTGCIDRNPQCPMPGGGKTTYDQYNLLGQNGASNKYIGNIKVSDIASGATIFNKDLYQIINTNGGDWWPIVGANEKDCLVEIYFYEPCNACTYGCLGQNRYLWHYEGIIQKSSGSPMVTLKCDDAVHNKRGCINIGC